MVVAQPLIDIIFVTKAFKEISGRKQEKNDS